MDPRDEIVKVREKSEQDNEKKISNKDHLGSSNAFEETENPLSRDADNISDEKLDELLGE